MIVKRKRTVWWIANKKGPSWALTAQALTLFAADMCHGVARFSLIADCAGGSGPRTAKASRSRLLALRAARHHGLVRMGRVSHSNRHANCEQSHRQSLQHTRILPDLRKGRHYSDGQSRGIDRIPF
jgi:hypothetical protein